MLRKFLVTLSFTIIPILLLYAVYSIGKLNGIKLANKEKKSETEEVKNDFNKKAIVSNFKKQNISIEFRSEGMISSITNMSISPEVQGELRKGQVQLKKGVRFSKGQLLYSIKDSELKLSLKARKSNYLNLIANSLPELKIDYPSSFPKWNGFYSAIDIEKSFPSFPEISNQQEKTFITTKNLISEYYNIKADEERLKKYYYLAPFSGTITEVYTNFGAIVSPGSKLCDVIQNNQIEVQVSLKDYEAEKIKIGSIVNLSNKSSGREYEGKVSRIGDFIQSNSQSTPIYISFIKNYPDLKNGMFLTARIKSSTLTDVYKIPRRALINDSFVYSVYDSTLRKVAINIEANDDESVIITGINERDAIVIEPIINPKEGMKISPIADTK